MSILFPHINDNALNSGAYPPIRLGIPSGAGEKPASQSAVFGCFVKTPPHGFMANVPHTFLAGQGGATGGNDSYVRFEGGETPTTIGCSLRRGGVTRFNQTVTAPPVGNPFLFLLIINADRTHIVTCEPGGTPNVVTDVTTAPYDAAWTASVPMISGIGGGTVGAPRPYAGNIEEVFMLYGSFPEVSGSPQAALIQSIADGSQDIATLASQLTGGSNRFRYRMLNKTDLSDSFSLSGDLVKTNENAETGFILRTGGDLRPRDMRPSPTSSHVSQAVFSTAGDTSTASADVVVEGGTYANISPAAIQARLLSNEGEVVVDWTEIDGSPSAGSWTGATLPNVPMTVGMMDLQIRAVDGDGNQIGEVSPSGGLRGVGFSILTQGQSQLMFLWGTGNSIRLSSGVVPLVTQQGDGNTVEAFLGEGEADLTSYAARGVKQMVEEIAALYPGYPIHVSTVGQAGQSLEDWDTGGAYVARWSNVASHWGVSFPYYLLWMGHSNPSTGSYRADLEGAISEAENSLGSPVRHLIAPTARYAQSGTGSTFDGVNANRIAQRDWFEDNKNTGWFIGSMSHIVCDAGDSGPHPDDTDDGQGRSGAMLAWGAMSACRAVQDQPLEIGSAVIDGTSVVLKLTAVNEQ